MRSILHGIHDRSGAGILLKQFTTLTLADGACRSNISKCYFFIINLDEMIKLPAVYKHYKKYLWVKDLTAKREE